MLRRSFLGIAALLMLAVLIGALVVSAAGPGDRYDVDRSGYIEAPEVVAAFNDYFDGVATQDEAVEVWMRFAAYVPVATPSPATPTPLPPSTATPIPAITPTPTLEPIEELLSVPCRRREAGEGYARLDDNTFWNPLSRYGEFVEVDVTFVNPSWAWEYGVIADSHVRAINDEGAWVRKTIHPHGWGIRYEVNGWDYMEAVPFNPEPGERNRVTVTQDSFVVNGADVQVEGMRGRVEGLWVKGIVRYEDLCVVRHPEAPAR